MRLRRPGVVYGQGAPTVTGSFVTTVAGTAGSFGTTLIDPALQMANKAANTINNFVMMMSEIKQNNI